MNKFLISHLLFYVFSVASLLLSYYYVFDDESRWSPGAFPEVLWFILGISTVLFLLYHLMLFVSHFHTKGKAWRYGILILAMLPGIVWIGLVVVSQTVGSWTLSANENLSGLLGSLAVVGSLISIIFSLLAIRKQLRGTA